MLSTPAAVLFACNLNRVRSPMAAGLLRRRFPTVMFVDSCGVRSGVQEEQDPFVVAVMAEVGVDLTAHVPKTFGELEDESFDLVISLTPEAQHRAVELTRGHATEMEYWPTHDPTLATGSRDAILAAYREVRDALSRHIEERFPQASTMTA